MIENHAQTGFGITQFQPDPDLLREIGQYGHHPYRLALRISNGIECRLDPDRLPLLIHLFILPGIESATAKLRPEFLVMLALAVGIGNENLQVASDQLILAVAHPATII